MLDEMQGAVARHGPGEDETWESCFFGGVKIINHISSIYTMPDNPGNTFPSFWIFWGLR